MRIAIGGFAGARFFFSDAIGAYVELGYGLGIVNAGLAFKF